MYLYVQQKCFRTSTQSFYFWILEHIATFCRNKILDLICFLKCFLKAKFYERKNTAFSNFVKTMVLKYIEQKEKVKTWGFFWTQIIQFLWFSRLEVVLARYHLDSKLQNHLCRLCIEQQHFDHWHQCSCKVKGSL